MPFKFLDFFHAITGQKSAAGSPGNVDPKILAEAAKAIDEFNDAIIANNKEIEKATKALDKAEEAIENYNIEIIKAKANGEKYNDLLAAQQELIRKKNVLEHDIVNAEKDNIELKKEGKEFNDKLAASAKITGKQLTQLATNYDEQAEALKRTKKPLDFLTRALSPVAQAAGLSVPQLEHFAEEGFLLAATLEMAAQQIVEFNSKLLALARTSGGVLNNNALGFTRTGGNTTAGIGSLGSVAGLNNLTIEQFLDTFKAFSDGSIIGLGTTDLQNSQEELQKYGIEVGRISKLYGVSNDTLAALGQSLSQNFGVKIKDISNLFEHGAEVANTAGISVAKFFENLKEIANLSGSIFIRGGTAGLEKAAYALSKLGLSANALERIGNSITDFGSLIDKQNRAAALGFQQFSQATARIFAKTQTGDTAGALILQQVSLAQDIKRIGHVRNGQIDQQGINMLRALGVDAEDIKGIGRLIREQAALGISMGELVDETNLSTVQLSKKRKIEQENATFTEKLGIIWAKIKATFVDPLADVLGPVLQLTLSLLSGAFSTLFNVLKPVILVFQEAGKWMSQFADWVEEGIGYLEAFLEKLGIKGNTAKIWENIASTLGLILAVVIGIGIAVASIWAFQKIKAGIGIVGDLFKGLGGAGEGALGGVLGGGLLGKAGRFVGKGFRPGNIGLGAGIGIGGGLVGAAYNGLLPKDLGGGDNGIGGEIISDAASGAGIGVLFGPWGAAIGGLLGGIYGAVTHIGDDVQNISKNSDASADHEQQIAIASTTSGLANASTPHQLQKLLKSNGASANAIAKAQEQQMNKTFSNPISIILHNHNQILGKDAKSKFSGH